MRGDDLNAEPLWRDVLAQARWFGGKGRSFQIARVTALPWYTADGQWPAVRSEIAEIAYDDGASEVYHLLAGYRRSGPRQAAWGLVDLDGLGQVELFDPTGDPVAASLLVTALVSRPRAGMRWLDRGWFDPAAPVRLFRGEQSNTSLLIGSTAMLKIFRRLEPGPNLDAEALAGLNGSGLAPRLLGTLSADGTDLAMFCELIDTDGDGWKLATASCAAGQDFTAQAAGLGRTLRALHTQLAAHGGISQRAGAEIAVELRVRVDAALAEAPVLAPYAGALEAAIAELDDLTVACQRIHRDFHLGQVLHRSDDQWVVIDFEGEPLTTADERRRPDSRWRDVAGALRSFDYVRSAHPEPASPAARRWCRQASGAFLKAYAEGEQVPTALLRAYQLDKAVYEVRYELRNRPEWAHIPLGSVQDELTEFPNEPRQRGKE